MSEKGTFLLWWWLHACNPSAWEAKAEFEASLGYKVTLNVKNKDKVKTKTAEGAGELAQGLSAYRSFLQRVPFSSQHQCLAAHF